MGLFGALLGPSWGSLGPSWGSLGSQLSKKGWTKLALSPGELQKKLLGAFLGHLGAVLAPSWAHVGPKWAQHEQHGGHFEAAEAYRKGKIGKSRKHNKKHFFLEDFSVPGAALAGSVAA